VSVATRPWLRFYGEVPATLEYPAIRVDEAVARAAAHVPDAVAYDFLGTTATYRELQERIERCARGLASLGLGPGERITISFPSVAPAVMELYAVSLVVAVSRLMLTLSAPAEIAHYLTLSKSRFALTLDAFYGQFAQIRAQTPLETLILARIGDELSLPKRIGFWATRGRKIPAVPAEAEVVWWRDVAKGAGGELASSATSADELATILYSGGTTGFPKGIMLSHASVTSEAMQVAAWVAMSERDVVLAVLPIFHGFGLGALVHAGLISGAKLVMVPQFSAEIVAKLMRTKRPTLMAGVPTLFDSLARDPALRKADLSSLRAAFSGADTLQQSVRDRFERLVADRGGHVRLLEGYGLTEAVTAIMGNPLHAPRVGTVGIPFPDVDAKICTPGTETEVATGTDGEICVAGPPVMLGYLDDPAATAETLRTHADGRVWLHTGDVGHMDDDGFVTFAARSKRMIKSSGFNVYPGQVEAVLQEHPVVAQSCVIGVPDEAQGERVRAVVVLRDQEVASDALAAELIDHCRQRLIKWSCPRDVEFRADLPLTKIGKVDFRALEAEAASAATAS
jgi:long-chain acyl-CoA synthetase